MFVRTRIKDSIYRFIIGHSKAAPTWRQRQLQPSPLKIRTGKARDNGREIRLKPIQELRRMSARSSTEWRENSIINRTLEVRDLT
ncbi:hypothetical protein TNCT_493041 [Trichonephila clavata]|uniref:Uncharacterized protein n=1 Tax=Trichonephila clavata TaxID=2740835 RepID=A0A8X6M5R6_TRICU|nr:hypothetical protein TNCT_493041 [Trichonephila clavata]